MKIDYHRPAEKGVTQLMYVGDDGAGIPTASISGARWWLTAVGIFVLGWWAGKKSR